MTVMTDHPLGKLLEDAAFGSFPPSDGRVAVYPSPSGPCDVAISFTGHAVVAADVPESWVLEQTRDGWADEQGALSVQFLGALADRLGCPPTGMSVLLASTSVPVRQFGQVHADGEVPVPPFWTDFRNDVQKFRYRGNSGTGYIGIGRGPAGRWDGWIDVEHDPQSSSTVRGRELAQVAKSLAPARTPLFASVPAHNVRLLRSVLAAGLQPVGTEVLFLRER